MGHIVKDTDHWVIDVNSTTGRIFLQMRWKYNWQVRWGGHGGWSTQEKREFHRSVDRQIWAGWSNRVRLSVRGTSRFASRFRANRLPINLDVRWVTSNGHWDVNATKVGASFEGRDFVNYDLQKVQLYTTSLAPSAVCNDPVVRPGMAAYHFLIPEAVLSNNLQLREAIIDQTCTTGRTFSTPAHEFGHAIGTTNRDEYTAGSRHRRDTNSMLGIGRELRTRHFTDILNVLDTMIPNTTFEVAGIRNKKRCSDKWSASVGP